MTSWARSVSPHWKCRRRSSGGWDTRWWIGSRAFSTASGPIRRPPAKRPLRCAPSSGAPRLPPSRGPPPLPSDGASAEQLVDEAADLLLGHSLRNGHPRFMGYITSSAAPLGALAGPLGPA